MAGKKKAQAGGSRLGRPQIVLITVAIGALVLLGALVVKGSGGETAIRPVQLPEPLDARTIVQMADGIRLGDENAPIQMWTFIDFQCPACAAFGTQIEPLLRDRYVQTGKVAITYYDWPIVSGHPHAFVAARAARCAKDQDRFWEYHDVLLGRQSVWSFQTSVINTFIDYAAELGLDRRTFEGCLKSDRHAQTVTAGMLLGDQLGVTGTPTLFLNGLPVEERTWEQLRERIDRDLAAGGQ